MGSVAELKDAVKDALQRKGLLSQLQVNVRSQIFNVLLAAEDSLRPEPADETLLINELIREYLVYNGLLDTLSVFIPESGQPAVRPFDRDFLAKKLRIHDSPDSQQVPLLYHIVARQQQVQGPTEWQHHAKEQITASYRGEQQQQRQQQQEQQSSKSMPADRLSVQDAPDCRREQQHTPLLRNIDMQFSELQSLSSGSHSI